MTLPCCDVTDGGMVAWNRGPPNVCMLESSGESLSLGIDLT